MAKSTNILSVYLAVGDDSLKRAEVLSRLKARLEQEDDLSFDCDDFDAEMVTGKDVVAACETMPFMASKRLVLVRNAEKFKKADLDELTGYVQAFNPATVLALSFEKLVKNTKLYKAVASLGKTAVIECALPKGRELQRKVIAMASAHGIGMNENTASLLIDYVGSNTVSLDNEVAKIALICSGNSCITREDVKAYAEETADAKPWKFLEPFSERDLSAALQWIDTARNVSCHVLVPQCAQRLRELICVKSLQAQGASQAELLTELGYSQAESWKIKNHARYAREFSASELRHALISLRETDKHMKSGADPNDVFSLWVAQTLS